MKIIFKNLTLFLILFCLTSHTFAAETSKRFSLTDAIAVAVKKIPGEVVKAEFENGFYEVKIKTAKGVKKVYVDAKNGSIIERKNISLDKAVSIIRKQIPGEIVKIEFEKGLYKIKVRTNTGLIEKVYLNSRDGRIVRKVSKSEHDRHKY